MKINKNSVLIGSDFEMFLVNREGKVLSAIPFINAGKKFPEATPRSGCCIQHDGVLSECNIPPVRLDEATTFWENIRYVKNYINEKFADKEDLELTCCPSAELEDDQLQDPEARESGCSPSFNAWLDGEVNPSCSYGESKLRVAGGHIHISFEGADVNTCIDLMKCFDAFLTVPALFMDPDDRRRTFYGKAGEMRLCDWGDTTGFEARTLSNFWVESEQRVAWVFNQLNRMFDYYNEKGMEEIKEVAADIIEAINLPNRKKAGEICDRFGHLILIENPYELYTEI